MLDKAALEGEINDLFESVSNDAGAVPATARGTIAEGLADIIDRYIKSATIVYAAGLVAPPGGGPVTGIFTGQLT